MNAEHLSNGSSAGSLANEPEIAVLLKRDLVPPDLPRISEKSGGAGIAHVVLVRRDGDPASISICLASALRNRWVLYLGRRQQFEHEPSEEAVHELRVATRRLMAQLDLFAAVISSRPAAKAYRAMKQSMKALGRLRDLQVQRLFVEPHVNSFPQLMLFSDDLQKQEAARVASAAAKIRSLKIYKFEKWISLMFQDLADRTQDSRQAESLASGVIQALQGNYATVVKRRRSIRKSNPEAIHKTRIAFKKFRYIVETLSPGFTGFDERQLGALALYQRRMGAIQDIEIIQSSLDNFVARYAAAEELLRPFARQLRRMRARALAAFMKEADQIYEFCPSELNK